MTVKLLDEEFLTETDVGEMLGLKTNTLRIQSARRKGPPRVKLGNRVLYRKTSLLEWMLSNERFHEKPDRQNHLN